MSRRLRDRYALNQSPLFRIRGKGQFESIIGIEWDAVKGLVAASPYRVWSNAKGREIQQPLGKMEASSCPTTSTHSAGDPTQTMPANTLAISRS